MQQAPSRRRGARIRQPAAERRRLLDAMAVLACDRGWSGLPVLRICQQAGMSRAAFYEHFTDSEDCFAGTVEDSLDMLWAAVESSVEHAGPEWAAQVSAAITGFLGFLLTDPPRAWMGVVEPLGGSERVSEARQVMIGRLAELLRNGPVADDDRDRTAVGTVAGTVGGLWEMARQYLSDSDGQVSIDDIAGSAIFLALTPYVGREEAMRHAFAARGQIGIQPPPPTPSTADDDEMEMIVRKLTELASGTVGYLAAHPEAANDDVAAAIGIGHKSQVSRHLRSLEDQGLANRGRRGRTNAWTLTPLGREVAEYLQRV